MSYLGSCNPIFRHRSPNPNQTAAGALVAPADTFHLGHTQYLGKSTSKELHLHPGVFFPPKSMETLPKIPPALCVGLQELSPETGGWVGSRSRASQRKDACSFPELPSESINASHLKHVRKRSKAQPLSRSQGKRDIYCCSQWQVLWRHLVLCRHSHTNMQRVQKVTSNCSSINHAGLGFRHAAEKCEGQGPRRDHLVPFGSPLGPSLPSVSFCLSPFIQMETNYLVKK